MSGRPNFIDCFLQVFAESLNIQMSEAALDKHMFKHHSYIIFPLLVRFPWQRIFIYSKWWYYYKKFINLISLWKIKRTIIFLFHSIIFPIIFFLSIFITCLIKNINYNSWLNRLCFALSWFYHQSYTAALRQRGRYCSTLTLKTPLLCTSYISKPIYICSQTSICSSQWIG